MVENLNVGTMINSIVQQTQGIDNTNLNVEKYCYENNSANCSKYGGLYLWDEMMAYGTSKMAAPGPQGICPTGWHVPVDIEWICLEKTVGGAATAGVQLKDTVGWIPSNGEATNNSGFKAVPGSYRYTTGSFGPEGYDATFWTSTQFDATYAWYRNFYAEEKKVDRANADKPIYGFSVRCIKN